MKRILIALALFGFLTQCSKEVPAGKLTLLGNWSPEGLSRRDVWVWTPPNYDSSATYPVIYMHDGQMLFDSTSTWNHQEWQVDEWMNRLIFEGKIRPAIVVGIDNGGNYRHTDYFPEDILRTLSQSTADSLIEIDLMKKPRGNRYVDFLIYELKPYIAKHYSVSENPSDHFVMGSSMGGLVSLYCTLLYPEEFGGAACLSTHWLGGKEVQNPAIPKAILNYTAQHLPNPYATLLYFDHGTEGLDRLYSQYQEQMDSIMEANHFVAGRGLSMVFAGDDHNEKSWSARLDHPLIFLLGNK